MRFKSQPPSCEVLVCLFFTQPAGQVAASMTFLGFSHASELPRIGFRRFRRLYLGEAAGIANNLSSTTALRLISVNVRVQPL
jgi:hypothetical protein